MTTTQTPRKVPPIGYRVISTWHFSGEVWKVVATEEWTHALCDTLCESASGRRCWFAAHALQLVPTVWVYGHEFYVEHAWLDRERNLITFMGSCTPHTCNNSIRNTGYNGGNYTLH